MTSLSAGSKHGTSSSLSRARRKSGRLREPPALSLAPEESRFSFGARDGTPRSGGEVVDGLLNSRSEGDDMFSEEEEDRLEDSLRENEEIRSSDEFWRRHAELGEASAEARAGTGSLIERIEAMMSFLGHSSDGYKEEFQSVVNSSRNPKACFTELSMDMKKRNRYANVIPLDT